jgi:hypothetical protein
LISQNTKFLAGSTEAQRKQVWQEKRFYRTTATPSYRGQTITQIITSGESYCESIYLFFTHRAGSFVVFGLELFNTAFRRSRFDFQDKQMIARLDSLVKLIGNALYSSSEPVLIASLKASASILQCPLKSVPSSAPLIARQVLVIIRSTGSGESDVAQAGLKALTSILRKCEAALIKEKDLLFLIELALRRYG